MIESNYNYYALNGNKMLCLNGISKIILSLDNEEYEFMKRLMQTPSLQQQYPDVQQRLARAHFLVDSMENEINYLRQLHEKVKSNGVWHLIINPTQDCNFRCWYCYEKHPKSKMQPETVERIKKLIRNIFEQHEVKHFMLGWFGGEPLMYFNCLPAFTLCQTTGCRTRSRFFQLNDFKRFLTDPGGKNKMS